MIAVLDTSAAVAIALGRADAERAAKAVQDAELVLAPQLLVAELANVLWKYHHLLDMPRSECQAVLEDATALPDRLMDHQDLFREAFGIACRTGRPAYDAFFLALARRNDAVLITLDAKLTDAARELAIETEGL